MKRIGTHFNTILFLLSLVTTFRLDSQELTSVNLEAPVKEYSGVSPWEEVYLHIDREKYVAGEDIWFSIYTMDRETGKLSDRSAVAYVELLNPWNIPVLQTRFQLSNGRGNGNFLLPDSISSGTYTIRAYTNWMKNFLPDNCYMLDIEIYNTFRGSDFRRKENSVSIAGGSFPVPEAINDSNICIAVDSIYSRRQKVSIKAGINNNEKSQKGITEMSISVTPSEVASVNSGIKKFAGTEIGKVPLTHGSGRYRFESDGHFLSLLVKFREGNVSDSSDFLFMSIKGKVAEFKYAGRDKAGRYNFILPVDDKIRNLIIQPEHANNNMILEIEPSFSWILPPSYCFKDTFTDSQVEVFSRLSFNYQAMKIYGLRFKKEVERKESSDLKKRRFYGIPEMEVFLDDYIRLPVMQEVFFELLPGILLRSKKSGYDIKITNPLTGMFYDEPPLVMIDGVIINDMTVLADLNPEIVEKIEVVKTPYLIGSLVLHGIVNVITRSGNFSSIAMPDYAVELPYRVIDKTFIFTAPDYSDEQNRSGRTPDLRNTLYWNPSVKTNRDGTAEIEFWTSDLPGIYIINIQGISGTGEKVSGYKSFTVR